MRAPVYVLLAVLALSGCISGKPSRDTYTDKSGKTSVVESDRESCERSCNDSYTRCMDTTDARSNSGIKGPANMFGASSDCRNELSKCLPACKSR